MDKKFPPLTPDQIEAVQKWICMQPEVSLPVNLSVRFHETFSTPPEPEYIPGRWLYYKGDHNFTMIGRLARPKEDYEPYFVVNEKITMEGFFDPTLVGVNVAFAAGSTEKVSLATPEQIQHHLSLAAEKKGFKPGVRIILPNPKPGYEHLTTTITEQTLYTIKKGFCYDHFHDTMWFNDVMIYQHGSWAGIVQEEKVDLPKDFVDMSSVSVSFGNPTTVTDGIARSDSHPADMPFIGQTSVPPLPADGKWCVVITNYIQQNHFGIDVPGVRGNYYYSEVVNGSNFHGELLEGYTLISEEQFRRWVRGEKCLDFDHTIGLSHASPFVKSGPNPAHDITTYPKEFKDGAVNMRNEAAKTLLEDQPQHDQWEYTTEPLSQHTDVMKQMGDKGWEAWSQSSSLRAGPDPEGHGVTYSPINTVVHFKRRKQ